MTAHPSDPNCPACGYGQPWGIQVQGHYDGILLWQCPSCAHRWPRFDKGHWHKIAVTLIEESA